MMATPDANTILALAARMTGPGSLCSLFRDTRHAAEKEAMVGQTIYACRINHQRHGECFSIKGDIRDGGLGLAQNIQSYAWLVGEGYFAEGEREIDGEQKTVIFPTEKLVDKLRAHFKV